MLKTIIIILISIISLVSCQDYVSGTRFNNDYVVVSAVLYGGETISKENPVFIGKTIDVRGGNIFDFFYDDAVVKIIDIETGNMQILDFFVDITQNRPKIGYYDTSENFIIESGKTYKLIAYVNNDSVWATTTVPNPFEIMPNPGFTANPDTIFPKMVYNAIDSRYTVELNVFDENEKVVMEEYYCMEEFKNAYFILDNFWGKQPETESDYESTMTGFPRKRQSFYSFLPRQINSKNIISLPFLKSSFIFYGKHRLTISVIDNNYYSYLYKTQGYFHGGINNGIGYFGSATRQTIYTEVTR